MDQGAIVEDDGKEAFANPRTRGRSSFSPRYCTIEQRPGAVDHA
jgi:hypothetical protein